MGWVSWSWWLASPPEPPILRHPVALRVFFGHLLAPEDLRAAIVSGT